MRTNVGRLRIVILECPYTLMQDPDVQPLFGQALALRIRGYGQEHKDGALPVDTYDFVGTHQLICRETPGLVPILGFRTITMNRCSKHRLRFPAFPLLMDSNASSAHIRALEALLKDCGKKGAEIAYHSSWTIDPDIRKDRDLTHLLKEMVTAMLVHSRSALGFSESILCGVPRFKTDLYFEKMGYRYLQENGEKLGSIEQANLFGEPVYMMHRQEPSLIARGVAARFETEWRNRLQLHSRDWARKKVA